MLARSLPAFQTVSFTQGFLLGAFTAGSVTGMDNGATFAKRTSFSCADFRSFTRTLQMAALLVTEVRASMVW